MAVDWDSYRSDVERYSRDVGYLTSDLGAYLTATDQRTEDAWLLLRDARDNLIAAAKRLGDLADAAEVAAGKGDEDE